MGALDRADAVDLHKAEFLDELEKTILPKRGIRRGAQSLPVEENQSRIRVRNQLGHSATCSDKFEHIKNFTTQLAAISYPDSRCPQSHHRHRAKGNAHSRRE